MLLCSISLYEPKTIKICGQNFCSAEINNIYLLFYIFFLDYLNFKDYLLYNLKKHLPANNHICSIKYNCNYHTS